jgi:hypothetical protein
MVSVTTLDTMGWDLVFATTFATITAGIQESGAVPAGFSATDSDSGGAVDGGWGSWRLVDGSPGNLLWLECTVASGTFHTTTTGYDLAGSQWTVQFGLTWQTQDGPVGTPPVQLLVPAADGAAAPVLIDHTGTSVKGSDTYALVSLMSGVLVDQVGALGPVFMSLVLGGLDLEPDQPWLVPTSAAYACAPLPDGDPRLGVFALLATTENRDASTLQSAVDRRVFDAAPTGTEVALVLGPRLVVEQLLIPGAQAIVLGTSPADFAVDSTGTVVYNQNTMTWGELSYDLDDGTSATVTPVIEPGNFELALDGELIHVSLSDVRFAYPGWHGPGNVMISLSAQQFYRYTFTVNGEGYLVMAPEGAADTSSYNVTITPDQEMQAFQIAVNVAVQVVFAILGGLAGQFLDPIEGSVAEGTNGSYSSELGDAEVQGLVDSASPEDRLEADEDSAQLGGDAAANQGDAGYLQKFKGLIASYKFRILVMALNKLVGLPAGQMSNIAVLAAREDYAGLPALDPFAVEGQRPVTWPHDEDFTLTGGSLNGALVFYGTLAAPPLRSE